jgi:hypothetical protein
MDRPTASPSSSSAAAIDVAALHPGRVATAEHPAATGGIVTVSSVAV